MGGKILKLGLHAQKLVMLMGFDNACFKNDIAYIRSHLLQQDGAITKKKVSITQSFINITLIPKIHDSYHLKSFLS